MSIKANVERDGSKTTIEGKSLIDLVEKIMMDGGKGVTMVQILRDGEDALDYKPDEQPK